MTKTILVSLLLMFLATTTCAAASLSRVENVRYAVNGDTLRIVVDMTKEFEYKEFYVENPSRLVVDIEGASLSPNVTKNFNINASQASRMRVGQFNPSTVRIVIETIAEIKTFVLDGGPSGCRLVIDVITPKSSTPKETVPSTIYQPPSRKEDDKSKAERERKLQEERERKAKEERELKAKEERERKLQEKEKQLQEKERELKAREERQLKEEKERKAKEEKERKAKEERELKAKEERERKAKEERERKHKEETHQKVENPAPTTEIDKDLASLMTLKGKIIAIDPGHGGNDAGAIGPSGVMEKTVTLNVALELEKMLKAEGATIIMTRHTDKTVSPNGAKASAIEELQARCDVANHAKAHIFISIHADSFTNASARGTTGYYYSQTEGQASIRLADCIRKALCEQIRTPSRGTKPCNFYVVKNTDMPATLIELAFISNPDEENILSSPEGVMKCAQGIFDGIEDYFG